MNEQVRRAIASYTTYQEAERAVDHLSDQGFPVERVAIIGQDVRLVEQVTGRMGHGGGRAAGRGERRPARRLDRVDFRAPELAGPGRSGLLLAWDGLVFGALVGALLGRLVHAAQRGRRDFASVSFMQPSRYDVVADEAVAYEAMQMLAELPSWTGTSTSSGAWKSSRPRSGAAVT